MDIVALLKTHRLKACATTESACGSTPVFIIAGVHSGSHAESSAAHSCPLVNGHGSRLRLSQSPKQSMFGPAATATYWFPATMYVIGDAFIRTFVGKCHKVFPSRSSTAAKPPLGCP